MCDVKRARMKMTQHRGNYTYCNAVHIDSNVKPPNRRPVSVQ